MLERLEALVALDRRVTESLASRDPDRVMAAVERALLAQGEVFAEAVAQLTSDDVQGCAPEQQRAKEARARGNALFQEGQYGAAVESYTEALQHQQALTPTGRAAASRLYSNRAAALLRFASGPTAAAPNAATAGEPNPATAGEPNPAIAAPSSPWPLLGAAPASSAAVIVSSGGAVSVSLPPARVSALFARAALEDARCAAQADPSFAKAYYRAACARRALGDILGAMEDCRRAMAAGPGGPTALATAPAGACGGAAAAGGRGAGGGSAARPRAAEGGGRARGGGAAAGAAQVDEAAALLSELQLDWEAAEARTPETEGGRAAGGQAAVPAAAVRQCYDAGKRVMGEEREEVGPLSTADPRVIESSTPKLGRHLLVAPAAPPLEPAADVLYDWPLAAMLCKRWRRHGGGGGGPVPSALRCWRCTASMQADEAAVPYPCQYCPMAVYCSPYCRDHDLFHVPGGCECGLPWSHLLPEEAVLALRLARRAAAEDEVALAARSTLQPAVRASSAAPPPPPPGAAAAEAEARGAAGTSAGRQRPPERIVGVVERGSSASWIAAAAGAGSAGEAHLATRGSSPPAREVLGKLLAHCESLDPPELLRTAVVAATTAAAYRAACHTALRRWHRQRLQPPGEEEETETEARLAPPAAAAAEPAAPAEGAVGLRAAWREAEDWMRMRWLSGASPAAGRRPPEVMAAELTSLMCRVRVNGIAVRPDATTSPYDRVALALYPRAAALNHSCAPNLGLRFRGLQLVARTSRRVPPGQPLTISYGPQLGKATRRERRAQLRAQYAFTCGCEACADPRVSATLEAALWGIKCPACTTLSTATVTEPETGPSIVVPAAKAASPGGGGGNAVGVTGGGGAAPEAAPLRASRPADGDASEQELPGAVLPTDPRIATLCGGRGSGDDAGAAEVDDVGRGGSSSRLCTRCGRCLAAATEAAAATALAAASKMAEQAAEALGEDLQTEVGAAAGSAGVRRPPTPRPAAELLAAWRRLERAAELLRRVLPDTNRLVGATLHQLGLAALMVMRAAPGAVQDGGGGNGATVPRPPAQVPASSEELALLAGDAARYVSYSLRALQMVYGACSTEVLYELELIVRLLEEMPAEVGTGTAAGGLAPAGTQGPAAQHLHPQPQPVHHLGAQPPAGCLLLAPERCPYCSDAGGSHAAALHSRLNALLVAVLHQPSLRWKDEDNVSGPGRQLQQLTSSIVRGGSAVVVAANREGGDAERPVGPLLVLGQLREAAWALQRCMGWHVLGLRS